MAKIEEGVGKWLTRAISAAEISAGRCPLADAAAWSSFHAEVA